ncbi:MAG TPA: aminotransferase class III-fold pyridoxal phosphate-dependent enzyme [Armatimonadota bacterium]|nr:aminotransferase class III-fold pyridoxal phosphate-dependent enzyme [Armatimonadota bacterium]
MMADGPLDLPAHPEALTLDTIEKYRAHFGEGLANILQFGGYGVEWCADGCLVYDAYGREFIDCVGIYGVMALGHRRPEVVEAAIAQMRRLPLSTRNFFSDVRANMAAELSAAAPGDLSRIFFCHSGAEAVEAALKCARIATGKSDIISTEGSFHGKTLGALSASGREKYKKPFAPLVPGFKQVPFGDAAAVDAAIDSSTAAVIVEPIQGEGGVVVPPAGYLRDLRAICDHRDVLLILDEVQTGLGRTGRLFACQHEDVAPDIMTLAKALGGGVAPLAAMITTPVLWDRMFGENPWIHTTTVVNLVALAAGRVSLRILQEEKISEQAARTGSRLMAELCRVAAPYPDWVVEVRGKGLLIGMEVAHPDLALLMTSFLTARGVIVAYTMNNPKVIRIEPPLIISDALVDRVIAAFEESLKIAVETVQSLSEEG